MAALAKMNALSESLRSSMPEAEESRPGTANTKAGTPSSIRRSSMREDGKRNSVVPGGNRRAGRDGAGDMAQLAADYDEVRQRYEEVLKENESLKADANRRIESNLRREKKYEFELNELRGELARQARGPTGDSMDRLREEHKRVLDGVANLKQQTASVLAEQERDLLRAFRARLYDVQVELERVRSKKDDGALEWIEKSRSLSKELDWSREEALRLDRVNQFLSKESARLKTQLKSYEDDRELMVRKMLGLKKENARLKTALESGQQMAPAAGRPAAAPATSASGLLRPKTPSVGASRSTSAGATRSALSSSLGNPSSGGSGGGGGGGGGGGVGGGGGGGAGMFGHGECGRSDSGRFEAFPGEAEDSMASQQRLKELSERQAETEAKYKESINKLKRLLEVERRNLRAVRAAHAKDLQGRTELETLLRACADDVRREMAAHQLSNARAPPAAKELPPVSAMGSAERERVLELLLSQERVVALLYEKTFPPRSPNAAAAAVTLGGEDNGADA